MERFNKVIAAVTSLVTGVLGLMGAVASLWAQVREAIPLLRDVPPLYVALVSLSLISIAISLVWKYRPRARPPLGLTRALDIGNRFLEGRSDDIDRLLRCLNDSSIVWLIGESGAGKSSLVKRGLLPELQSSRSHFGIYIDNWGTDWIEGPRRALIKALLSSIENTSLGTTLPLNLQANEAFYFLAMQTEREGRLPIIIFDQFDDYQTRHRDLFLSPQNTVLSEDQLVERNEFWFNVQALVESGKVHCLFVTRTDSQWGLESVRFKDPKIYLLGRIENSFAAELLRKISLTEAVESSPDSQVERLQVRLIRDLGPDGWILPIQMRVAFRGLAGLLHLDTRSYEDEGGLAGLEALHISLSVTEAARKAGLSLVGALKILIAMTERSSEKTVPRTEPELCGLSEPGVDMASLHILLEELEAADILRQRVDQDLGQVVWLLDHDYLLRGILQLDLRTRRWPHLLEDSYSAFRAAPNLWRKGLTLLPPSTQIRLIWERLRGRLQYGKSRMFACLSGLRFVANIWAILIIAGLFTFHKAAIDSEANQIFSALGLQDFPTAQDNEALWRLAKASKPVRMAVIEKALELPSNAQRFNRRNREILNATVGIGEENRDAILDSVVQSRCNALSSHESSEVVEACAVLLLSLGEPSKAGVQLAIRALTADPSPTSFHRGGGSPADAIMAALAVWSRRAGDGLRKEIASLLLLSLERSNNPAETAAVVKVFSIFHETFDLKYREAFGRQALLKPLIAPDRIEDSIAALSAVIGNVPPKSLEDVSRKIVKALMLMLENGYSWGVVAQISDRFTAITAKLPTSVVDEDCRLILVEMRATSNEIKDHAGDSLAVRVSLQRRLSQLSGILGLFDKRIPPDVSREAITLLVASIGWSEEEFYTLALSLGPFSPSLPADVSDQLVRHILVEIEKPLARNNITPNMGTFGTFRLGLGKMMRQRLSDAILKDLETTTNYFAVDSLLDEFAAMGDELPVEKRQRALMVGLATIQNDPSVMSSRLPRSLRSILRGLPSASREVSTNYIIDLLGGNHLSDAQAYSFAFVLDPSMLALFPDVAWRAYNRIIDALDKGNRWTVAEDESAVLTGLGETLTSPRLEQAMSRLRRHFLSSDASDCGLAASLVRPQNLRTIVSLMKWPACSSHEQSSLLEAIGKVEGESFGVKNEGYFAPDLRSFSRWAAKKGLDIESPPTKW